MAMPKKPNTAYVILIILRPNVCGKQLCQDEFFNCEEKLKRNFQQSLGKNNTRTLHLKPKTETKMLVRLLMNGTCEEP